MVTSSTYIDNAYKGAETFFGLSDDSKPTSCGNGSCFIEMDSGKIYLFDGENSEWLEWGGDNEDSGTNEADS